MSKIIPGCDVLLGMDIVEKLGGVSISPDGRRIQFCHNACLLAVDKVERISDKDFTAEFVNGRWLVSWNNESKPCLTNMVPQYRMDPEVEEAFSSEINQWIENGWLQHYEGEHDGIIPLMAVVQVNKSSVRPVLDFRELHDFVSSHTGSSVVC